MIKTSYKTFRNYIQGQMNIIQAAKHKAALEQIVKFVEDADMGDAAVTRDARGLYNIAKKALNKKTS